MTYLKRFGHFWWDFIVGDDWRAALGILIAIALTAALVAAVTAGLAKGAGEVAQKVLVDGYARLKGLLARRFGDKSEIAQKATSWCVRCGTNPLNPSAMAEQAGQPAV